MELKDFHNLHAGQTCLIAGVGPNLGLTPPEQFNYPSFGVNTIYKYEGWKPTYFVGVDARLQRENADAISEKYRDVHKFIPRPDRDSWQGENFHRFYHRPGPLYVGGHSPFDVDIMDGFGISYYRIMDAVFQIAAWMGFTTLLCIGFHHMTNERSRLFWGTDESEKSSDFLWEEIGYRETSQMIASRCRVLNISEDTHVPEDVLPRGDWKGWRNA